MNKKAPVVITGAAGGIGQATIRALAGHGQPLHLVDPNEAALNEAVELAKSLGLDATAHVSAMASPEECAAALPAGNLDIAALVHLAGIFVQHQFDAAGREVFDQTMQANAINAYDLVAAADPRLTENSRLVFVSSLAFNRGSPDHIGYSMAKGSLVGLTRSLSRALGPRGILVNALAPGIITTPMPAKIIEQRGDALMQSIPLGRFGKPEEVAGVIEFLLGPASSYITGQLINIDGGIINS